MSPVLIGGLTGLIAAFAVDLHTFKSWQRWDQIAEFDWRVAAFRWAIGAASGAIAAAGLTTVS